MKYFHVIYNSSQKNFDGGIGFGFRTMTEGIPESYVLALRDNMSQDLFFQYRYGTYVYPSPSALFENTGKVLDFPKGYAFAKVKTNDGNAFYLLERIIPVGFDYTYYLKNAPGRLGNYVVDCYIFPEIPSPEVFGMLYENPEYGSKYFIPKSPVPDQANEEMKVLSLGAAPALPAEEKSFASVATEGISDKAIELLFAYIEARKKGKKLIVKYPWKDIAPILADFIKLLPEEEIKNATFCTNYHYEGLQEAFQIICINEYYQYEIPMQAMLFDLGAGNVVSTKERDAYKNSIADDVAHGYMDSVYDQVRWIFSSAYSMVQDKSVETGMIIYAYCIDREKLFLKGGLLDNDEAVNVLKTYLDENPSESRLLIARLCQLFMECKSLSDYAYVIEKLTYLRNKGIGVSEVIDRNKELVSRFMLQSSQELAQCIQRLQWNTLKEYAVKSLFEQCKDYRMDKALWNNWIDLYPYFYTASELSDKKKFVYDLYAIGLPEQIREAAIRQQVEASELVRVYIALINERPDAVKQYASYLIKAIEDAKDTSVDLLKEFEGQIASPDFVKLFVYQFKHLRLNGDPIKMLRTLTGYLDANGALKSEVGKSLQEYPVYDSIYQAIESQAKEDSADNASICAEIDRCVLPLNVGNANKAPFAKWYILKAVLENTMNGIDSFLTPVYDQAKKMHFKKYFKQLLPKAYKKFDVQAVVKDMKDMGMTEDEMLKFAKEEVKDTKKNMYNYIVCIYRAWERDFNFVYDYLTEEKVRETEDLLDTYYAKEYQSYKKKQKIKRFFSSIMSIFKRKKKS